MLFVGIVVVCSLFFCVEGQRKDVGVSEKVKRSKEVPKPVQVHFAMPGPPCEGNIGCSRGCNAPNPSSNMWTKTFANKGCYECTCKKDQYGQYTECKKPFCFCVFESPVVTQKSCCVCPNRQINVAPKPAFPSIDFGGRNLNQRKVTIHVPNNHVFRVPNWLSRRRDELKRLRHREDELLDAFEAFARRHKRYRYDDYNDEDRYEEDEEARFRPRRRFYE